MITTFTGPMHSSKSETMIKYYNKIYNKDSILVFKPKVDTRDEGIIRSKGSSKYIDAICIKELEEIEKFVNEDILRRPQYDFRAGAFRPHAADPGDQRQDH